MSKKIFMRGFRGMLGITTGIIPFGAVMGTVSAEAQMSFFETVAMNWLMFAGAAQLAAVDLMTKHATVFAVVATGLIINMRFILYSAALSPVLQKSNFLTKILCSYVITDQSYSVMVANESKLETNADKIIFYTGTAVCMVMVWHLSVMAGYVFGNFAPAELALDYAVPLSFVTLVMPTLKSRKYIYVTIFSSIVAVILKPMPFNLGLITTTLLALVFAILLTRKKRAGAVA